jgi:hypothetical protein
MEAQEAPRRPSSARVPRSNVAQPKLAHRPASAGTSRPNGLGLPGHAKAELKSVGFTGRVILEDSAKAGNRSSWGFWQGKKFSIETDRLRNSVWGSGDAENRSLSPRYGKEGRSPRHVSFLDSSTRKFMLNSVKKQTAQHIGNIDRWSSSGTGPQAFIPKLRPRILAGKADAALEFPRHLRSSAGGSPARMSASTAATPGTHLLSELNLPSLAEADMEYHIQVEPLSTALSVDGELALSRLDQAGPGSKFCDGVFDSTSACIVPIAASEDASERLLSAVYAWKRPEEFGLSEKPSLFDQSSERASDVIQGELGDCYLLGAMSVVATRKELLDQIFSHFKHVDANITYQSLIERGLLTVQLYKVRPGPEDTRKCLKSILILVHMQVPR